MYTTLENMLRYRNILVTVVMTILCDLTFIHTESEVYNVSLSLSSQAWTDALNDDSCDVIGKGLPSNVSATQLRVDLESDYDGEVLWIGSTVRYTSWINFKGCTDSYAKSVNKDDRHIIHSDNIVRDCFQLCNSTFVISSNLCVCYNAVPYDDVIFGSGRDVAISPCYTYLPCIHVRRGYCVFEPLSLPLDTRLGNCKTYRLTDGKFELRNTPCSERHALITTMDIPRSLDVFKLYGNAKDVMLGFDRIVWMEYYLLEHNLPSAWVGIFRYENFEWYNGQQTDEPLHCLAATVNKYGSLRPSVRQCNNTLKAVCITKSKEDSYHTTTSKFGPPNGRTSTPDDINSSHVNTDNCQCECVSGMLTWIIVVGVLEGLIAIAMVIAVIFGFYWRKRVTQNHTAPVGHPLYSTLNTGDRLPPPVYDVLNQQEPTYDDAQYDAKGDYVNTCV